jgi:erythronate-4-phosphate dehydrogenase
MQIIADENIPYVKEAFTHLGEVHTMMGRQLTRDALKQADILLVRSVTPVNQALLANTPVRFVGTATIGIDHIDLAYLQNQGIGFASAPGSNATAAAEYVISALLVTAERQGFQLNEKVVGIIGCGHVGSKVLKKLIALGVECLVYDPPLQENKKKQEKQKVSENFTFVNLKTVLSSDIITLHVPLEKQGRYPTYHLVNASFLSQLKTDVILINTSRGAVVDETALLNSLSQPAKTIILDVWNNEPQINPLLLQQVALGTPHIAGYSFDGKVRGTEMLYTAICDYFKTPPLWQADAHLPQPPLTRLTFSNQVTESVAISTAIMACYDIRRDDAALRRLNQVAQPEQFFDQLRKHYPLRREFNCVEIELPPEKTILASRLRKLGFKINDEW